MNYEFKGTKRKWALLTGYKSCGVSIGNRNTVVFSNDYDEDLPNALLISKAPEMLEALIKCEKTLREVYQCDTTELKELLHSATNI